MRARLFRTLPGLCALALLLVALPGPSRGAGVTVATHGFSGNIDSWIIPMGEVATTHPAFPGQTLSCYQISITRDGSGQFVATATFLGGTAPLLTDSGEIFVKLDWSTLAGFGGASSTEVAEATAAALLAPGLIPEMNGRPLAELPLHLAGHSRGGSVVTELARFLGAHGVWVDQVTTWDPRPVPLFGDAGVTTYTNVLFADNFWQTLGNGFTDPIGQSVFGAFNRKLVSLEGGYSSYHSDVHLWYHATIDLATPASDTQATVTAAQRSAWWTASETAGATAGFYYSRIGGGDRLSALEPAGMGTGRVRDGFNMAWDLGGGVAANRTALPANSGAWPNPIRLLVANEKPVPAGQSFAASLHYQSGASPAGEVELRLFLDADANPYNGNEIELAQYFLPNTGTTAVELAPLDPTINPATVPPGDYVVGARLSDGLRTRWLYAQRSLTVTPSLQPPAIDAASLMRDAGEFRFHVLAFPGQTVTVQATTDFTQWIDLETRLMTGTVWEFVDAKAGQFAKRFYRARLTPAKRAAP